MTILPRVFTRSSGALEEGESLVLEVPKVTLSVGEEGFGEGTLRVTSARILWEVDEREGAEEKSAAAAAAASSTGEQHTLQYQRIILHAVCRDVAAFPVPCMYLQVTSVGGGSAAAEGEEEEIETLDVYFAPHTPNSLDDLFTAMTKCAELHPDDVMEEEGGEGGGGGMFSMGAGGGIISGGYDWADKLLAQAGGGEAVRNQFDDGK